MTRVTQCPVALRRGLELLGSTEAPAGGFIVHGEEGLIAVSVEHDKVICCRVGWGDEAPEELGPAGEDLQGSLRVLQDIASMARAVPEFQGSADDGPNTRLEYMYRDGANYKSSNSIIFASRPRAGALQLLAAMLRDGTEFIPGNVGLADLQDSFEGFGSYWDPDLDHVWHEITDVAATAETPTSHVTFDTFLETVAALVLERDGWDEQYLPPFHESMVERYKRRDSRSELGGTEDEIRTLCANNGLDLRRNTIVNVGWWVEPLGFRDGAPTTHPTAVEAWRAFCEADDRDPETGGEAQARERQPE